jgi:metacaspase-1
MYTMSKKALLIGINYYDNPSVALKGCVNDVVNMRNMLIDAYGYNSENITVLRDDAINAVDKPTAANIVKQLGSIIAQSASLKEIWIHYSGHGSQISDINGDERDMKDEVIVPADYSQVGLITDDIFFNIVKQSRCPTVLIFDSCNSGTVCDLMWNFNAVSATRVNVVKTNNTVIINPNIYCFSGCRDEQTSADVYSTASQQACGAMSSAIMECLRWNKHNVDVKKLYLDVVSFIKQNGLTQVPQLSSSSSRPMYKITRAKFASTTRASYRSSSMAIRNMMKRLLM